MAPIRYLSLADTERLDLRMAEVVPAVKEAFRLVGEGRSATLPRVRLLYPPLAAGSTGQGRPWERDMRITPGALEGIGYAVRIGTALRRSGGGVMLLLFDWDTMNLKALISDHLVHAVRSTACNGVLAQYLALPEASALGVVGSGRLARWATEAVCSARRIRRIRVWSPTPEHRAECVRYLLSRSGGEVDVAEARTAEEAVTGAHVVITAAKTTEPVLEYGWLEPGSVVISNAPEELDEETVARARLVTTYRAGVLGHTPPFRGVAERLAASGAPAEELLVELVDVVVGRLPGRVRREDIIACLNPAYGMLDAATAAFVYEKAMRLGVGVDLVP